jgi:hypothetical protein
MWDRYDFNNFRLISDGLGFANAVNDLGRAMQLSGMMKPYNWSVVFLYNC